MKWHILNPTVSFTIYGGILNKILLSIIMVHTRRTRIAQEQKWVLVHINSIIPLDDADANSPVRAYTSFQLVNCIQQNVGEDR